jgi:hypothetical protein
MKFTIRDIMLVTVIVALATGWFLERQELATLSAKLETLVKENKRLRFQVEINEIGRVDQSQAFAQYKVQGLKPLIDAQKSPNSASKP